MLSVLEILRGRPCRGRSSMVPCCLIFVIRDMAAGDRSPFCQKCKMAERFVFIIFEFRCEHIFIQKKGCF